MNRFNVFLSYTTREEEVKKIKPLLDIYCRELWKWAQSNRIEIFYDDFTMEKRQYADSELEHILEDAIKKSQMMTAFLSPEYVKSKWCQFEYLKTREPKHPPVHAIFWKWFNLGTAFLPYSEYLLPETYTDIMYLRETPTTEEFERAAKDCVENSVELIRAYYKI